MRLDELFEVKNGVASSEVTVSTTAQTDYLPFIRPASTQQRTVAGWVDPSSIPKNSIYEPHTLFVSTDGEGSHTYAYVSQFKFVPNSNVSVLVPKRPMTVQEKLFYARCITLNRFRFSYGRKPKGERLKSIQLPQTLPSFVDDLNVALTVLPSIDLLTSQYPATTPTPQEQPPLKLVSLNTIFNISYGTSLELNQMSKATEGINFVSRTSRNNGISAQVHPLPDIEPLAGNALTVALGGSVLETFYQHQPFYTGFHVAVLRPLQPLTAEEMLFYCAAIRANQYRYSYGRQANKSLKTTLVPATECVPPWVYGSINRVCTVLTGNL